MSEQQQQNRVEQYRTAVQARVHAEAAQETEEATQPVRRISSKELFEGARNGEKGDARLLFRLL